MKKTMIVKAALAMLLLLACGSNVEAQTQKRQVKKLAQSVKLSPSKAVSKQSADSVKEVLKAKEVIAEEGSQVEVFDVVERMPEFPGGFAALMKWLSENVKYPSIAEENGIQGRVVCKFVVERNGSITEVKVAKSVDPSLDKEAVRVLKSMPKWIPGMQDGVPVRVKYAMPVTFKLVAPETANKVQGKTSGEGEVLRAKEVIADETPRNNGETVFNTVERMPEFAPCTYDITMYVREGDNVVPKIRTINNPGGSNGLIMFLNHNVKYPPIAEENGIQGRVVCKFVVERDGSITEVTVARSVDPVLDKEAVRVLKSMPKWIPGMQDGKPVRVQYTVPVTFKLQ